MNLALTCSPWALLFSSSAIDPGDTITTDENGGLFAVDWSYSFVNTSKYEAWLGAGLNFQRIDTSIDVSVGGGSSTRQQEAKGTVPIPTLNFGGRWNFSKRWRVFVSQELFGLKVEDAAAGVLQDIHWAAGLFGYFPTYALGNIYAGELCAALRVTLPDLDRRVASGDFAAILVWLPSPEYFWDYQTILSSQSIFRP